MKKESGITLIALVITVIVILIIAGISVYEGRELINTSKIQTLETNMLKIQVKAKEYAEGIEAKVFTEKNEQKDEKRNQEFGTKGFTPTTVNENILSQASAKLQSNYVVYAISEQALIDMGLKEISNKNYVVIFSKNDYKIMDIIYIDGIQYKNATLYTLSALQDVLENE